MAIGRIGLMRGDALEVATGAYWSAARRSCIDAGVLPSRCRCGMPVIPTQKHEWWHCPYFEEERKSLTPRGALEKVLGWSLRPEVVLTALAEIKKRGRCERHTEADEDANEEAHGAAEAARREEEAAEGVMQGEADAAGEEKGGAEGGAGRRR